MSHSSGSLIFYSETYSVEFVWEIWKRFSF
jgi:hypothetical protein